jgi:hypothetical protein
MARLCSASSLGGVADPPADVFTARDVGQFKLPDLNATTVSSPGYATALPGRRSAASVQPDVERIVERLRRLYDLI